MSTHDLIADGLARAWAAEAEQRYGDAEQVIHVLHVTFGSPAVEAVAAELHPAPPPKKVRHA